MKRSTIIVVSIVIVAVLVLAFIMFGYGYTKSFTETESETVKIAANESGLKTDSISVRDMLMYNNTLSFLVETETDKTVCVVWRKSIMNDSYKMISTHSFDSKEIAFVAQDYFSNILVSYENGKLAYVSSEMRQDVLSGLIIGGCLFIFSITISVIRRKKEHKQ